MKLEELSKEQELLLLTSRVTLSSDNKERIIELVSDKWFDWLEFYKMALYHKTATLCWFNIDNVCPNVQIPSYLYSLIRYCKKEIKLQNELFMRECDKVVGELKKSGVLAIPVKGVRFVRTIYGCNGTRYMGDFDYLVYKSDSKKIEETMHSLGDIQGQVNFTTNTIEPLTRAENIKWKMAVSNFAPYLKMTDDDCNKFFKFDFRHSLDDTLEIISINKILDYAKENGDARPAHLFIHLCTHFYGEAKRTISIFNAKDFNIIKLTDIREFVIRSMNQAEWEEVIHFSKEYKFEKQVYFTLFITRLLFGDGYETPIMEQLGITDDSFFFSFGDSTLNEEFTTERSLIEKLFSCRNIEDIENVPKFLAINKYHAERSD